MHRLQVGGFGFILEELGGIGHLQEEIVEIPDQLLGVRFNDRQQPPQGLGLEVAEAVIVPDLLEGAHGCGSCRGGFLTALSTIMVRSCSVGSPGRGLFPEQPAQDLAHQALGQLGAEFDDFGDFVERQLLAAEVPNLLDVEFAAV